ncbi:hypothetical protein Tco_0089717 [Tanacetum coccineum]
MTKVIKGEFEKIKDVKVEDVSLTCDTPLEIFNKEVSRLCGMDNDLFTYEVEVANIPCNSKMDDDSEDDADDDMGNDPSDVAFIEWLRSKNFNYKTMDHYTMKALWIYWIRGDDEVDPDLLTKDIMGFKTYDDYKDDWIYEWNKDVPWVDEKPWTDTGFRPNPKQSYITCQPFNYKTGELKDEALRNKAIMEGFIKDDDDESSYEQIRRWDIYTNYDDTYNTNHNDNEREELCKVHEPPVCTIQRFEMIKYSFGQGEEYVAIKEDEYDDLARTSNNACCTYQEIFRMMDEGWMVTRAE